MSKSKKNPAPAATTWLFRLVKFKGGTEYLQCRGCGNVQTFGQDDLAGHAPQCKVVEYLTAFRHQDGDDENPERATIRAVSALSSAHEACEKRDQAEQTRITKHFLGGR